jgi:ABC-type multidrug transport system permease subunit
MSDAERILNDLAENIRLLRNICIFIGILSLSQLIFVVVIPDILTTLLKTWLIVIAAGGLIGIIIGLIISKNDPKTSQFFIFLSVFLSGLITGISIPIIIFHGRH